MEIDINNEEEILKKCDFDYYYNSLCGRELCMFYNDISKLDKFLEKFDTRQAYIDLGRIAITLNKLFEEKEYLTNFIWNEEDDNMFRNSKSENEKFMAYSIAKNLLYQRIKENERLKECIKFFKSELIVNIRSLFNSYASSLIDYCIWNKNADENSKLYNNFKKIINNRLEKVLDLFDKRVSYIQQFLE